MKKIVLLFYLSIVLITQAQEEKFLNIKKREKSINNGILFSAYYGADVPVGELAKRFGYVSNIGGELVYRIRNNWMLGVDGSFLYSTAIKEFPIDFIAATNANHITVNGDLTAITPS